MEAAKSALISALEIIPPVKKIIKFIYVYIFINIFFKLNRIVSIM